MSDLQPSASLLAQGDSLPIAQLNPEVADPEKRVVHGSITITWPFSILHKSIAFLLAERDFRLRRENGQVRLRFHGAAARAITDASLGAGDEIRVSLQGAKWEKNETHTQVAGSTLEWQLEFTNRLILGIRRPEAEQETILDIDVPTEEPEITTNGQTDNPNSLDILEPVSEQPTTPTPQSPEFTLTAKRNISSTLDPNEYASPAFLKRARVSYGSLFEGGIDTFDDDVGKKTKSKKRTRFSLPSNAWRYASQSPSPEPEEIPEEADAEEAQENGASQLNGNTEDVPMDTPQRALMVDQGSQTADVDFTPMASVQVMAESRPPFGFTQLTPTPFARTRPFGADDSMVDQSLQFEGESTTPHDMPPVSHQSLLGHSPTHMDTDMAFTYTPQAVLFPHSQGFLPEDHVESTLPDSPTRSTGAGDYPAELLEADQLPSNVMDNLTSLADHGSQPSVHPHNPFDAESPFPSALNSTVQPLQSAWATEVSPGPHSAHASSDAENPVEILSSSPFREQGSRESSQNRYLSPSRENTAVNTTTNVSPEPALEEPASEAEYYRDGGDEPGDDYDLRKYSRAHDDDDDVETSEDEPEVDNDDPEAQIMNPEEEGDADVDEDLENQEGYIDEDPDEYAEEMYERRSEEEGEEYEGSEGDAEGEYYSDEEDGYDDEEEEDEEAETRPFVAAASQEPVFISLLSDSEDDDEPAPAPASEPEHQSESELDSESVGDEGQENEPTIESKQEDETKLTLESEPNGELEESKPDEEITGKNDISVSEVEANESSIQTKKDADLVEDAEGVSDEEAAESENASLPVSPVKDSTMNDVEAAEAPAVQKADEDESSSIPARDTAEGGQSIVNSSTRNDSPTKEEKEEDELEIERKPSPLEARSDDIDMDHAPPPVKESEGHEKEDIIPNETITASAHEEAIPAVVEKPAEAMDVDVPTEQLKEDVITTETTVVEVVETGLTAGEEAHGTTTEVSQEASASVQMVLAEEEPLAEPHETQGTVIEPSNVLASEGSALDGQAVLETQDSQHRELSESHDAVMQDALSDATAQPASQLADASSKTDDAQTEKAHADEQLAEHGRISPPPTQAPETQVLKEDNNNAPGEGYGEQLPTPGETQQMIEVEMVDTLSTVTQNNQVDEADVDPEDQIMAEILQHSPIRPHTPLTRDPFMSSPTTSQARSPHPAELTDEPHDASPGNTKQASEIFVAKPLRSRRNKSNKTADDNGEEDPSLALVTSTPTTKATDSGSKHSSPIGSGSKTRSKTNRDDPSIQLAGGSVQAEVKNKRKRKATDDESVPDADNSSPGSQRILRPRNDHGDPSILLAKGSSPTARQLRSLKTPDPKREPPRRETRSVSRSLQIREESPDASFTSLKSPSIAGSAGTVPEEEDAKTLKLHLLKSLRTNLPDYLSLKLVSRNSLDKMTDILAVVTQTPAHPHRPKHGPRDFMLTLSLTDPSTAPTQVRVVNIFRPHLTSLPEVEAGDVILLRRVKVVSMKGRGFGVRSEDSSSWAVSKSNDKEILSQVKGPPVETTAEEIEYAKGLRQWWSLQDDSAMDKIETASRKVTEAGKENAK
ncbi:hypothetical protein FHETE_10916 [Fusarium heterosporum]|uniref:Telomeric single stranded DNA binding POT1/Cdc13 domain-containing protein n=1 Tax=Fusarium heterosporum TaxID=42747 RepID=A0A8H5SPD8_FUSHE|nr:hypothetical protein FHETE_10916 [Fusarium heterosporum]